MAETPDFGFTEPSNSPLPSWWVPALFGVLSLVAGLVVIIEPHTSLLAVACRDRDPS